MLVFGEIGLTGEVRRVSAPERRIMDGLNLGFTRFIVPDSRLQLEREYENIDIVKVKSLEQALKSLF